MYRITNNKHSNLASILANSNVTRFLLSNHFLLPKVRTNYGEQNVYFSMIFFNSLPLDFKSTRSLNEIKTRLKDHTISTS